MRPRLIPRLVIHRLLKTPPQPFRLRHVTERPLTPLLTRCRTDLHPPACEYLGFFAAIVRRTERAAAEDSDHVSEADAFGFFEGDDALEAGFELFAADEAAHELEVAAYPGPAF